jgi:glyoxylase-like metal-dependent hydrolase (beta-lactamase superfamily II)
VDAGTPNTGEKIMAGLDANGIAPEDISLILITHGHFDHVGSVNYLRELIAAPVAIGRDDAEALRAGTNPPANLSGFWGGLFKLLSPPGRKLPIQTFEPEVIIEDELDLKPYGVGARVIATPGHTAGSLSVITSGGEAIVGDLLISSFMSFGGPTIAFWAWSKEASLKSVQRVLALKPKLIRVTHGGPFSAETVAHRYPVAREVLGQRPNGMKPGDRSSCCAD